MTQEEKQLLVKDLCARLPYGVIVNFTLGDISFNERVSSVDINKGDVQVYVKQGTLMCPLKGDPEIKLSQVKPYLRPLSSMSEEEEIYYDTIYTTLKFYEKEDWLNEHHFDYRIDPSTGKTLIESGLALEAMMKGTYKID